MASDNQQESFPWHQLPDETPLWFGRFERYRLIWPHSIIRVYHEEWREDRKQAQQGETEKGRKRPGIDITLEQELPKEAPSKWRAMARKYRWEERASAWDAHQIAEIEQKVSAEKTKVLLTGYALMYRRVAQLNEQVEQLIAMTKDSDKVWMPDVKSIGTGPTAERVDLVTFNAQLFHEIRATFDDIAKEVGERVKKQEMKVTLPKAYLETADELDDDGVDR
ncbi:MAG TPA: hypothetical protein VGM01_01460 [Ktedonobacteraceae bacterium]|jgi:hypothetical protein